MATVLSNTGHDGNFRMHAQSVLASQGVTSEQGHSGGGDVRQEPETNDADIYLLYTLVDPSDELPEDEIGLRISPSVIEWIDTSSREVTAKWNWKSVGNFDGWADANNPDDMDILMVTYNHQDYQFECEDFTIIIEDLKRARQRSHVAGKSQASARDEVSAASQFVEALPVPIGSLLTISFIVAFGAVVFGPILNENKNHQDSSGEFQAWTVIDGIYFSIVTMTTVGYGDLTPETVAGKIATIIFMLLSISSLGIAIRHVREYSAEKSRRARARTSRKLLRQISVKDTSMGNQVVSVNMDADTREKLRKKRQERATFARRTKWIRRLLRLRKKDVRFYWMEMVAITPLIAIVIGGGTILAFLEDWDFLTATYVSVATVTAVGYGDFSPKTQEGRLFSIFFIPVGVIALIAVVNKMIQIVVTAKHQQITSVKKLLAMDCDGDGEITLPEFQIHMLKNMHKVTSDDLHVLEKMFRSLDASGDGLLSAVDITEQSDQTAMQMSRLVV